MFNFILSTPLTIFSKSIILDVWHGSRYASAMFKGPFYSLHKYEYHESNIFLYAKLWINKKTFSFTPYQCLAVVLSWWDNFKISKRHFHLDDLQQIYPWHLNIILESSHLDKTYVFIKMTNIKHFQGTYTTKTNIIRG